LGILITLLAMMRRKQMMALSVLLVCQSSMAGTTLFQVFEGDGFGTWEETGSGFGKGPMTGVITGTQVKMKDFSGESVACSAHGGDGAEGSLTSEEFTIVEPYIAFKIAGGNQEGKTCVQLLIDGKVVKEAVGKNAMKFEAITWNVKELKGEKAKLRLLDRATGKWGMIAADHFIFTDREKPVFPRAIEGGAAATLATTPLLPGATVQKGVTVRIAGDFAKEQVTSPTAICFDERGNLFVSETHRFRFGIEDDRNHTYWYLDDLAAQTTADRRALHEKWKHKKPIEALTKRSEIVRVLSDKDGDGRFETSKVFADGFNDVLDGTAAGVFAMEGTVYLASIPKIWALKDENGDLLCDKKGVIQDGFGVRISLSGHDLNGFALGPDGMIHGTIGDRGLSFTTKEGKKYHYPNEGVYFRFEPDGSHFEILHTGLRNPKEIAFDAAGNAISVDNNSDQGDKARIVYLVPGGETGWQMEHQAMHTFAKQIGLEKVPINRWMAERMWEPQNIDQPAYILPAVANLTNGPSGLTYHPGVGFLEAELGRFLITDYRGAAASSGIYSFAVAPEGASMKLVDSREFNWGVGCTDVEYSNDGKVFVSDFINGWESHKDGRVYSLDAGEKTYKQEEAKQAAKWMAEGFRQKKSDELVSMLRHPDMRIRLRAQVELSRRPDGFAQFRDSIKSSNPLEKLHATWGLGIIVRRGIVQHPSGDGFAPLPNSTYNNEARDLLIGLLKDPDAETRAQSLRVLADCPSLAKVQMPLATLLKDDSSRVRFYASNLIASHKLTHLVPNITAMLEENNDKDPYLRVIGAHALASAMPENIFRSLLVEKHPAVRLATVVALRRLKSELLGDYVADPSPRVSDEAIRSIHDLMIESMRPNIAALLDNRDKPRTEMMWRRLLHSAFRCGGEINAQRLCEAAGDARLGEDVRKEAMRLLSEWPKPFPVEQSIGFYAPLPERDAKIIKQVLSEKIPTLIRSGPAVMAEALGLIEQYQLGLDNLNAEDFKNIVNGKDLPPAARAKAMDLYFAATPAESVASLKKWSSDPDSIVSLTALRLMVKSDPQSAFTPLQEAAKSKTIAMHQGAWTILGSVPGKKAADLFVTAIDKLIETRGVATHAIELLDAAKTRKEESVKLAMQRWEKSLPADDPLAPWMIALQGGDAERGEAIYHSHPSECMRCHRAGTGHEAGGEAGPNLGGVANRGDRTFLLQSLFVPGAKVANGYGLVSVTMKDGVSIGGILYDSTDEVIDIDVGTTISRVSRKDIKEMTPPISAMPPMASLLKPYEARDLVSWLSTLKQSPPKAKSQKKIIPVVLSKNSPPKEKKADTPAPKEEKAPSAEKDQKTSSVSESSPKTASIPIGSPTLFTIAATAESSASPEQMARGKAQYALCLACHAADGNGAAGVAPPLAGSEWVTGSVNNLIRIQLRGLMGPIKVKGSEYNLAMMALAHQSDEQIADVLTYIRNSFGNQASAVTPEQVLALRSEVGKPMLTVADLEPVVVAAPTQASSTSSTTAKSTSPPKLGIIDAIGLPPVLLFGIPLFALSCLAIGLKKND
jgi:quinoprotein glucose dehydrogenase